MYLEPVETVEVILETETLEATIPLEIAQLQGLNYTVSITVNGETLPNWITFDSETNILSIDYTQIVRLDQGAHSTTVTVTLDDSDVSNTTTFDILVGVVPEIEPLSLGYPPSEVVDASKFKCV